MAYHRKHYARWSRDDERKLRSLAKAGYPVDVLALKLGRSPVAVQQRASSLGVSLGTARRPWTGREDRLIVRLFDCGVGAHDIGVEIDRTQGAVYQRLSKLRSGSL